jgi:multiple sugar transport system permease protein
MTSTTLPASSLTSPAQVPAANSQDFTPRYWLFSLPAVLIVASVIVFPWLFTLYMSTQDWKIGGGQEFVGLQNFAELARDPRFVEAVGHTLSYYTVLVGRAAAGVRHGWQRWCSIAEICRSRGLLRGVFVMPMMATPVAVALVWTMMFHPTARRAELPALAGRHRRRRLWVYSTGRTVIPTLVLVEVWHWTPLVMLIVLGGLAAICRREPYESALIDGASFLAGVPASSRCRWSWPFLLVADRDPDHRRGEEPSTSIFAITQGGPGTASETHQRLSSICVAFQFYYDLGYGSAVAVVFFLS